MTQDLRCHGQKGMAEFMVGEGRGIMTLNLLAQSPENQETEPHKVWGHAVIPKVSLDCKIPVRPHFLKVTQSTNCCHPLRKQVQNQSLVRIFLTQPMTVSMGKGLLVEFLFFFFLWGKKEIRLPVL